MVSDILPESRLLLNKELLNLGLGGMKDDVAFSSIAQPGTRGHEG